MTAIEIFIIIAAIIQNCLLMFLLKSNAMTVCVYLAKNISLLIGSGFFQDFKGYGIAFIKIHLALTGMLAMLAVMGIPWGGLIWPKIFLVLVLMSCLLAFLIHRVVPDYKASKTSISWSFYQKILAYLTLFDPRVGFGISKHYPIKKFGEKFSSIFLVSMARHGSTAVADYVCKNYEVSFLSYGMSPFFQTPELYKQRRHSGRAMHRLHLDDLLVSDETPDAFDEPFLRILEKSDPDLFVAVYEKFLLRLGCREGKVFGFFKNNNNWRRLDRLKELDEASFVVLIREPKSTINSLLRNHFEFCRLAEQDFFFRDYLAMVGHTEFGPLYKVTEDGEVDVSRLSISFLDEWISFAETVLAFVHKSEVRIVVADAANWHPSVTKALKRWGVPRAVGLDTEKVDKFNKIEDFRFEFRNDDIVFSRKIGVAEKLYQELLTHAEV